MPTPEEQNRIITRIKERSNGLSRGCSVCGTHEFGLSNGYAQLVMAPDMNSIHLGGSYLPLVALDCKNCGHTILFNLITLGLAPELFPDNAVVSGPSDQSPPPPVES